METKDFTLTLLVNQSPEEVFNAVNDVRAWWINVIKGDSKKLNDEFSVHFWNVHYTKQKLVEFVPNKKVVWLVTESKLDFLKDTNEWQGTRIIFDISKKGDKTELKFTHEGLMPKIECYKECSVAWTEYINKSLLSLITTGVGHPSDMTQVEAK